MHARALKGDIVYPLSPDKYAFLKDGYVILFGNILKGVYQTLPKEFKDTRMFDYSGKLIIPSFTNSFTVFSFDEENVEAEIEKLWQEGVLRLNTVSEGRFEESYFLMDFIESLGMGANCHHERADDKELSVYDLEEFSVMSANKRFLVKPIIFLEERDSRLKEKLKISEILGLKVMGRNIHKNRDEIAEYFGSEEKYNAMLNIIDFSECAEGCGIDIDMLPENNAYTPYVKVEHEETAELLKRLLYEERLGIYTGKAHSVKEAVRFELENNRIFSFEELFFMATAGSGKFFGNAGAFREFYSFDANVTEEEGNADSEAVSEESDEEYLMGRLRSFVLEENEGLSLRYLFGMKALGR